MNEPTKKNDSDDYLVHYGVLGMKWGVRKATSYKTKAEKAAGKSQAYESARKMSKNDREYNKYTKKIEKSDKQANDALGKMLMTKWDNISKASETSNGKQYIDQLLSIDLNQENIDSYERQYGSKDKNYNKNREYTQNLINKYKQNN